MSTNLSFSHGLSFDVDSSHTLRDFVSFIQSGLSDYLSPAVIVVEIALKKNDIIIAGNSKNMSDVEFDSSTIESGLR